MMSELAEDVESQIKVDILGKFAAQERAEAKKPQRAKH